MVRVEGALLCLGEGPWVGAIAEGAREAEKGLGQARGHKGGGEGGLGDGLWDGGI